MANDTTRLLPFIVTLGVSPGCYGPHVPVPGDADSSSGTDASTGPATTGSIDSSGSSDSSGAPEATSSEESGASICGDGVVAGREVCDDGVNDGSYGGCAIDCTDFGPHCGDGVEQAREACDDGDEVDGNGCNNDCVVSATVLWTNTFDGDAHMTDSVMALAVGPDDEVAVTGLEQLGATARRAWIRRFDSDGTVSWTRNTPGPSGNNGWGFGIALDESGSLFVAGRAESPDQQLNGWVREYDALGTPGYSFVLNGEANGDDSVLGIAVDPDGEAVAAGFEGLAGGLSVGWAGQLSSEGDAGWTRTFSAGGDVDAEAVAVADDGAFVIVGRESDGTTSMGWIRKFTPDGSELWSRTYDDGANAYASAVSIDADDQVVVVGGQLDRDFALDLWARKYTANGVEIWTRMRDTGGDVYLIPSAPDVAVDASGNVVVVGAIAGEDQTTLAWVGKYSPDGEPMNSIEWHVGGPTALATVATSVAIDSQECIVVGGGEVLGGATDSYDAWVRKLAP